MTIKSLADGHKCRPCKWVAALLLLLATSTANASTPDLASLDSCVAARPEIDARYEQRIARMKQQLGYAGQSPAKRLKLLRDIYEAYSIYQFDSALAYVKTYYAEAAACRDSHEATCAKICKAKLLAYGGFYNNAEEILKSMEFYSLPADLRFDYAMAAYWTYVFWSAFTMDGEFSERMDSLRDRCLNAALLYVKKGSACWFYLVGERSYFRQDNPKTTIACYEQALRREHRYGRFYSQVTFAIARGYRQLHNNDMYGRYLMLSARSHILGSVKENAAMQDLAMYIFNLDHANATLAHHYLIVAMDDATFFNNKLRKLEISNRLPPIVDAYQRQIRHQRLILWTFVAIGLLLAAMAFALYLVSRRKNAQLNLSHRLLEHKNSQLNAANGQLQAVNGELSRVNKLLRDANHKREEYLRLFVDICANTMNRINSYRNLVKLKIKAKQTDDLLRTVGSDRIATRDLTRFYIQFDEAFLGLYPDFVTEFAKLLQPEQRDKVALNKDGSMTTELRIFAFIRLGVTESSEIATLLSYSPHTIYNYRSAMKSRAADKDHFEENVRNLCKPASDARP